MFTFARLLASIHGHTLSLVDVTAKALLAFIEALGGQGLSEAVSMLNDVLEDDLMNELKKEDVTMMSSLRLQIDSLLASFAPLLTLEATRDFEIEAILKCSLKISRIDDWAMLVCGHFSQPGLILARLMASKEICPISASIFELAQVLRMNNKKWEKFFAEDLEQDETILRSWVNCFEAKCHPEAFSQYFSIMQAHAKSSEIFMRILTSKADTSKEEAKIIPKSPGLEDNGKMVKEVESMLQTVSLAMENNDVSGCYFYFMKSAIFHFLLPISG